MYLAIHKALKQICVSYIIRQEKEIEADCDIDNSNSKTTIYVRCTHTDNISLHESIK